ncbi:DNA mismatch repair protein MutS [Anaeroselena agilis]|uniref:DNA mismatch repair protein MutS n=1 Tax=Anaeroselena agilis TaxID=3063788 RepID=A0ABU3NX59_9FIRM|nr:DNA mismatch repair protein MutS [Selenomonadales bacterium 4137-cl]
MSVSYTPMMEQYRDIKRRHPDSILFFRLGDFYEMFFDDAELASRELEITLTGRNAGAAERVPMCGVPYHAADNYIARLISKGYRVAICEQVEDPGASKGIVRREVIRVVTPGTVLTENMLDKGNNYLVLLREEDDAVYLAAADVSTAECVWAEFAGPHRVGNLCDQLFRLAPAEVVLGGKIGSLADIQAFTAARLPRCTYSSLVVDDYAAIAGLPGRHFDADELPAAQGATLALALLLHYLYQTVKSDLSHLNRLTKYDAREHLALDAATLRNLEITANMRDGSRKDTLLSVLDHTKTAMGGRLLKKWLEYPLVNPAAITARQDAVGELIAKPLVRQEFHQSLAEIYDFERILTRIEVGTANARDLIALRASLTVLPAVKAGLAPLEAKRLSAIDHALATHGDVRDLITAAIGDNPPLAVREGGMIRAGYDLELDELRALARDSRQFVQDLEAREREATGIKSLKVGYNKVFGYYIEITNANAANVPAAYTRKQTLANAERYITPELKEFEIKILGAQEKIVAIEYHIFCRIREYVKVRIGEIQQTARLVAELDALASLAEAAVRGGYTRPALNNAREIVIRDGRHPVVEKLLKRELFVPNDTDLNHRDCEIMIITGPNMAGKSTYMRQVALLVLLAQTGSFIPAREASICPVDRVFTRVGASDDLATGQSTFMVEMNEVAHILRHATANSLIVLDEIGRGTSTFDGMSIARAVIEYGKDKVRAKTLFATHYHELTELEATSRRIKNFSVAVKERGNDVVFLRRIVPGGADKSYGIHVAQLAGLPKKLVERAQEILAELEHGQRHIRAAAGEAAATAAAEPAAEQPTLFASSLAEELATIDVMTLTPLEALNILYKLQIQAKQEAGRP